MKKFERLTDELWSSYLIRLLSLNNIPVSDFKQDTDNSMSAYTSNKVLTIDRLVDIKKGLNHHFVFGCFDRATLEERAFVTFPPVQESGEYEIEFYFTDDGITLVNYLTDVKVKGVLEKYKDNQEYDSKEVIYDLVRFADSF